jgi:hypothetical protein
LADALRKEKGGMAKTTLKLALFLVCGHLLLGVILMGIAATHGINDQDASFAVAMLFRCLNLPTVWALGTAGGAIESRIVLILFVGIVQWIGVSFVIAAIFHAFISGFRGHAAKTSQLNIPTGDRTLR